MVVIRMPLGPVGGFEWCLQYVVGMNVVVLVCVDQVWIVLSV